jgi:VCBS repeat-containing protein
MRKLIFILILSLSILSCSKEKDASIVGNWTQIARYSQDASGQFTWTYMQDMDAAFRANFTSEGTFVMLQRDPYAKGVYQYNYATKQLKLDDLNTNTNTANTMVSYLDEEYLVIDWFQNGNLYKKDKYLRQ